MSENPRLLSILERLMAFPTVTGNAVQAHDCLKYIETIIASSGMFIRKFHADGFESLVATSQNSKHPKLLLQAHLDVVPAPEKMFKLVRHDGNLYGRGVFDMKYAAACFVLLAEELGRTVADYDFGIMLTTDEEGTGQSGVKYLLEQGYGCDVCLLPDGGDNWQIEADAKGALVLRATAKGRMAHGSRSWEGDNAIERLLAFLKQAKKFVSQGGPRGTTMVISHISGGHAHNQVPDEATVTMDIRFTDTKAGRKAQTGLAKLAAEQDIILQTILRIEPVHLDTSLPAVLAWEEVVRQARGQASDTYAFSYGASDARFFAAKGIPCIVTRPDGGNHHGDNEWADEQGVYDFYECVKRYVTGYAAASVATESDIRYTADKLPETVTENQ